jgi:hypothetical protein
MENKDPNGEMQFIVQNEFDFELIVPDWNDWNEILEIESAENVIFVGDLLSSN